MNAIDSPFRFGRLARTHHLKVDEAGSTRIYSLRSTAKLNGLDPQAYLTAVCFGMIADHPVHRVRTAAWNLVGGLAKDLVGQRRDAAPTPQVTYQTGSEDARVAKHFAEEGLSGVNEEIMRALASHAEARTNCERRLNSASSGALG